MMTPEQLHAGLDALVEQLRAADGPLQMVAPAELVVDPARFQFRVSTINLSGTDGRLRDAARWLPAAAGVLLVWRQPDDRLALVDGHHRLRLALANKVAKVAVLEVEARDAREARLIGALSNVANGTAEVADVARLLRDHGLTAADLADRGISRRSRLLADAEALRPLDARLFAQHCTGAITLPMALALAGAGPAAVQRDLWAEAQRRRWSAEQVAEASVLARLATVTTHQEDGCLPGLAQLLEASNLSAVLAVRAAIRRSLAGELRAVTTVARRGAAAQLEQLDVAVIDAGAATTARDSGRAQVRLFDRLAGHSGPLQEVIRQLAALVDDRHPAAEIVAQHSDLVRRAIAQELS